MLSFTLSRIISSSLRLARPFNIHQQHSIRLFSTIDPSNESTSPTASSMSTSSNNRETGTVKRFSKEKGYGFISKNSDGTDCFVHFKNITGAGFKTLEEGQQVEFDIVQGDKGVEARDVNVIDDGTGRLPPFNFSGSSRKKSSFLFNTNSPSGTSSSSPFNFGGSSNRNPSSLDSSDETTFGGRMTTSRKPFNFATSSSTDKTFSSRSSSSSSEREMGSVKRWTSERGFGFIRRASGGADLFCHVRSLKNGLQTLEEGQTVQFRVQLTDRGEEARDVSILTEETIKGQQERPQTTSDTSSTAAAGSSTRETGVVRRWLPEKSYGFVRRSSGGSDVFVHMSSLTDGIMSLEEGQTVEFDVESTTKGDIARNVTVHNES